MHLFSSVEAYNNKECTCMASFLTPAYLRIAGPSTSHTSFENTTITIDNIEDYRSDENFFKNLLGKRVRRAPSSIKISNRQWREFMQWANSTGFGIVFALNNVDRTSSGLWEPNSALTALSLAEKANIKNVIWQLGYECNNRTIEEYLNDLETLRVLMETVQAGRELGWKVAGGDVTGCLTHASDFRDYLELAVDMTEVLLLNGNSTTKELERMSDSERLKVVSTLHHSHTPLWITDRPQFEDEFSRAADWMGSLGYSARNGFSVHFREMMPEELYEPTLSFYMALLYKNLVGERVLPIDLDSAQATLFAHCTSLRHRPVPRAITLYGLNIHNEPTRLSVKLTKREQGGEVMQFIIKQDDGGDIIVNGRAMSNEGDIRPVVKRVRPYKTLLIHLPPKSFGFWVLSNTNIEACQDYEDDDEKFVEAEQINTNYVEEGKEKNKVRTKRFTSADDFNNDLYQDEVGNDLDNSIDAVQLKDMIKNLNSELKSAQNFFKQHSENRVRRQTTDEVKGTRKLRRQLFKPKKENKYEDLENKPILNLIGNLMQLFGRNNTKVLKKPLRLHKKRYENRYHYERFNNEESNDNTKSLRTKRSIIGDNNPNRYLNEDPSKVNFNDNDNINNTQVVRALNDIQDQLEKMITVNSNNKTKEKSKERENLILQNEFSDNSAFIKFSEAPGHALKTSIENLLAVLKELNWNLQKIWTAISDLEDS
ncbi:hypothetical protein evm_009344 [Chilo suppressalis]|nr:hypothetical protein evm_009344 [Chilo suppressalis]